MVAAITRRFTMSRKLLVSVLFASLSVAAAAQPQIGDLRFLAGDDLAGTPVESQLWPQIAAGGLGYLVVWQDMRTVLCGFTAMPENPFCGNGWDIYAARLDADGVLLDPAPILVSQEGRNQTRPKVAWNGTNWLVVWERQRPEWYFFDDVVAARISPAGVVLDPEPIPLWLDCNNGCSAASAPSVASNGADWLVVWQSYNPNTFIPTLEGVRVDGDGAVLDPVPVVLQQHTVAAFGPRQPRLAWAQNEYLLAWNEAAPAEIRFKRFTADLTPLDVNPVHVSSDTGDGGGVRVATDDASFVIVTPSYKAYRINHAGQVLDPAGIGFATGFGWQPSGPDVAWDGFEWIVAFSSNPDPQTTTDADLYMLRINSQGSIVQGPTRTLDPAGYDYMPATASLGDGRTQLVWAPANWDAGVRENIQGANVADLNLPGPTTDTAIGLTRQAWPKAAGHAGEHLLAFLAQGGGVARILVERVAADGTPLDAEPTQIAAYEEASLVLPDVAWDGQRYLVVWTLEGTVWGRRVDAGGAPIDPAPLAMVTDAATSAAVGGMGGKFFVAYTHTFSSDQQILNGFRVDGATLAPLDSPSTIGFNYVLAPTVDAFADRWLVAWERQPSHDQSSSRVYGALVDAAGNATGPFLIDVSGNGDDPKIAMANDRALVVWHDNSVFQNSRIEGRLVTPDGGFLGGEILIADGPEHEYYPGAAWSGSEFAVAWMDFNHLLDIEQPRADVWATRLDLDGLVLDPGGFRLTDSPGPDDAPVLAGSDDKILVAFSTLGGAGGPEVQRIGYRVIGVAGGMIFADGFESGDTSAWSATQQ
jgi:hypothetical protein